MHVALTIGLLAEVSNGNTVLARNDQARLIYGLIDDYLRRSLCQAHSEIKTTITKSAGHPFWLTFEL